MKSSQHQAQRPVRKNRRRKFLGWSRGKRILAALALSAPLSAWILPSPVQAANATWTGTADTTWANASNWTAGGPPGTGNTATFNGAGNGNVIIDLGTGITVSTVLFDTSGAAPYTIGSGAVGSQTLTLNNSGAITVNSTVTNNELVNANLTLGTDATAQTYTITDSSTLGALTLAGGLTGGAGGTAGAKTLAIAGAGNVLISGIIANGGATSVAVSKTSGTGTLTLSGANTYTGGTTLGAGTLVMANPNALGAAANTLTFTTGTSTTLDIATDGSDTAYGATFGSGTTITLVSDKATNTTVGINHTVGAYALGFGTVNITKAASITSGSPQITFTSIGLTSGTNNSQLFINPTTATASIAAASITANGNKILELNGTNTGNTVTGVISNGVATLSLTKSNSSTWTLLGANTYTGATNVNAGTLVFAGPNGANTGISATTVRGGLTLDNTTAAGGNNNNRIADTTTIALSGGTFLYRGSDTGNSTETIGALSGAGNGVLTVAFGGTNTATLSTNINTTFTHGAGNAVQLVNGVNLGKNNTDVSSIGRILLANSPTLIGATTALQSGINSAAKNTQIVPFMVGEAAAGSGGTGTATGIPNTFVTYVAGAGLRPLNLTDEFTANTLTAGNNILLSSGTATASSSSSINSLVMNGGNLSINDGVTFNDASGALLFTSSGTIQPTGSSGVLTFGSNNSTATFVEGMVTVNPGVTATISAAINNLPIPNATGANITAFTKSGTGALNLPGTYRYTGATTFSEGVTTLTGTINADRANAFIVNVGNTPNANGVLNVNGGTLNAGANTSPSLAMGNAPNANGALNMTGGSIYTDSELHIGNGAGGVGSESYGALTMSGGTITAGNWIVVGSNQDRAALNQSGGSIAIAQNRITIGAGNGASFGVYNLSGGSFASAGGVYVGETGTGTLNVSGTASFNVPANDLIVSNNATANATVNLLGGTITTNRVTRGNGSSIAANFNFNGGTLKAASPSTTFMTGLGNAYVYSGGATIDDAGNNITIGQALLTPATGTGGGVYQGTLSATGSGFIDTPIVQIARGTGDTTGTGATAVATINYATGALTGITITNPGVGYTATPVFTLLGGGAGSTGTVTGAPLLQTNTSGGLTKQGAGILTLSGVSTYTGNTTVNGGTLLLSGTGSLAGNVIVNGAGARFIQTSTATTPIGGSVTITNGTLDGTGSITAGHLVTVADSANNVVANGGSGTAVSAVTPLTINALTFNGAGTLNLNTSFASRATPRLATTTLTTGATNASAGVITVNAATTDLAWQPGVYSLVGYTTLGGTGFSSFNTAANLAGLGGRQSASALSNGGGAISVTVSGDFPVWAPSTSNANWTTSPTGNWKLDSSSGAVTDFLANDTVLFDDSATPSSPLTVSISSGNVAASRVAFNNASKNYTISSSGGFGISAGSLVKSGGAAVTLSTSNSYAGGTTINAGTLNINKASAIGTGPLTFAALTPTTVVTIDNTSGAALALSTNNPQVWNSDFSFSTSGGLAANSLNLGNGAVTLTGNRTVTVNGASALNTLTVGGVISGPYGITKAGTATLVLSGSNTYSGVTTASNGILAIASSANLGSGAAGNSITLAGGTIESTGGTYDLGVNRSMLLTSGGTLQVDAGTLTVSGVVSGSGTLTKTGGGTLALTGTNTNTSTNVTLGTLNINGTTNSNLNINPALGTSAVANVSGTMTTVAGTLLVGSVAGGTGVLNILPGATISGTTAPIDAGTAGFGVINMTGGNVFPGQFLVAGITTSGAVGIWNVSGGTIQIQGNNGGTLGATAGTIGVLNVSGGTYTSNDTTNAGASGIYVGEAGTGFLNVSGTGVLNLGGTANSGAGLNIGRNNVATAVGTVNLGAVGSGGGTINTVIVQKTGAAATGTFNFHGGTLRALPTANSNFMSGLNNAYVYGEGGTIDNNGTSITIAQGLQQPSGFGVSTITTNGLLTSGYSATPYVTITGGSGTGATAIANVVNGNLTLRLTNPGVGYSNSDVLTVTLSGGGLPNPITSTTAVTAFQDNTLTTGGVNFNGSGTTTLSGINTYTGPTTIGGGGTLTLTSSASIASSSGITINSGTLDASGSLPRITVADGVANKITNATNAPNSLNLSGPLTFQGAATLNLSDSGVATTPIISATALSTGTVNAGGKVTINPSSTSGWATGDNYLIGYSGSIGNAGFGAFQLGAVTGLGTRQLTPAPTLVNLSGTAVALHVNGDVPEWTGANGANFSGQSNWRLHYDPGHAVTDFQSCDSLLFNNNATGSTSIDVNADVNVGQLTFNNDINYTIMSTTAHKIVDGGTFITGSGPVQIVGSVFLNGTGIVTLSTPNTFTGGATLISGTLNVNNGSAGSATASAIGTGRITIAPTATTTVTIDSTVAGITLGTNNPQSWNGNFTFTGTNALNMGTGAVTLNGNPTITVSSTDPTKGLTVGGVISGLGFGITKTGPGTLTLTAANTYTGRTAVSQGLLSLTGSGSITSATNLANATVSVGDTSGQSAVLQLSGTGSISANTTSGQFASALVVGSASGASGSLQISGGTIATNQQIGVGGGQGGYGALTQTGGTINSGSYVVVGNTNDTSIYSMSAGTLTLSNNVITIAAGNAQATGVMSVTGGTITSSTTTGNGNGRVGGAFVGEFGNGTLNIYGSGASVTFSGAVGTRFGESGGTGTVNLGVGTASTSTLSTNLISRGTGQGTFNFNGAILRATASNANFMTGLNAAYIYGGGATIDTQANNITIAQTLLAATGSGVSATGLTITGGSGYIDTPLVQVVGGDGIGCTAVATVLNGQVTGITITNPGHDYTVAPSFGLLGGGGIGASVDGTATLVANGPGSLNKSAGTGTLTLSATDSTYAGITTVTAGTLAVAAVANGGLPSSIGASSNAPGNLVFAGGTLQYNGANGGSSDRAFHINTGVTATINVPATSGSLTLSGGSDASTGALTKAGGGVLVLDAPGTWSYSGATTLSASGGTLLVNGNVTSTSSISIASGTTLGGTGTISGTLSHTAGTVTGGTVGGTGTLKFNGAVTLNGGALRFDVDGSNTANADQITINSGGSLNVTGNTTIDVEFQNPNVLPGSQFTMPLINYPGSTPVTAGQLTNLQNGLTSNVGRFSATITTNASAPLVVSASNVKVSLPATLQWTGATNGTWDVTTPTITGTDNWTKIGPPDPNFSNTKFYQNDSVEFPDGPTVSAVTLNVTARPGSMFVSSNSVNYSISGSGAIAGSTGITKTGNSTLTLSTANSYTGETDIFAGKLVIGNAGAIPAASNLVLGSAGPGGGVVDLNGLNSTVRSLSSGGGTANQIGNGLSGTSSSILTIAGGTTTLFSGAIVDVVTGATNGGQTTGLTVNGTAAAPTSLTITGNSTYNGVTTISANATLQFGDGTSGTLNGAAGGIADAGTLAFSGVSAAATTNVIKGGITGAGVVTNNNSTISFQIATPVVNIANIISGTGNIQMDGTNQLTLGPAGATTAAGNTFTGNVIVNSGTLVASWRRDNGDSGSLGNSQTSGRTITVNSGGTLRFIVNNVFGNQNNPAALSGGLPSLFINGGTVNTTRYNQIGNVTLESGGALTLNNTTDTGTSYQGYQFLGNITVASAGSNPTAPSTISGNEGNHLGAMTDFTVADVTGDIGTDLTVSTPLLNQSGDYALAAGNLIKDGPGTMLLGASSVYTGTTTINQGAVILGVANAIPTTSLVSLTGTLETGGLNQNMSATILHLAATSTLDFAGGGTTKFASSSSDTWTGVLHISNWAYGSSHLQIGTDNTGLSGGQLSQISFDHFQPGAAFRTIAGTLEVTPAVVVGDVNQDSSFNIADVGSLMTGLTNVGTLQQQIASLPGRTGFTASDTAFVMDVNSDGLANNRDLQAEIVGLANGGFPAPGGGSLTAVPEPGTIVLFGLGGMLLAATRIRSRREN